MIIVRSPLRISLGGGATDLPSYYRSHEGFVLSAAIDKYIYIMLQRSFVDRFILKYSKLEQCANINSIQHPLIRECLRLVGPDWPHMEIASMADIPSGTGLGSSGSFSVGLLKALHTYKRNIVTLRNIAEQACHIEIDVLGDPVGKQDQYIAAFGGITCLHYRKDDSVDVVPAPIDDDSIDVLEKRLMLFFTGFSRQAASVLKDQDSRSKNSDQSMLDNLHFTKELGLKSKDALVSGDFSAFAELMNVHWEHKRQRSAGTTNDQIDEWLKLGRRNGALGGKLVGAGGGGFLMFFVEDTHAVRRAMQGQGLREVRFRFDHEGVKVVAQ